jgi:hypothetical protein
MGLRAEQYRTERAEQSRGEESSADRYRAKALQFDVARAR